MSHTLLNMNRLAKMIFPRVSIGLSNMIVRSQPFFTPKQAQITIYADKELVCKVWSESETLFTSSGISAIIVLAIVQIAITPRFDMLQLIIPKSLIFLILQMHYCLIAMGKGKVSV